MEGKSTTRLIVKNIPAFFEEKDLVEVFEKKGGITDCKIMRTKSGKSRKFAFVGYKTEDDASKAREFFNNTYLTTLRIQVEFAKPIGDESLDQTYSRKRNPYNPKEETKIKKEKPKSEKIDPEYLEYRMAAETRSNKATWNDGTVVADQIAQNNMTESEVEEEEEIIEEPEISIKTSRIYITNLPYESSKEEIEHEFSKFGEITEVYYPIDSFSKKPTGFAFVTYKSIESARDALTASIIFMGRHLRVQPSDPAPIRDTEKNIEDDDESFKSKKQREIRAYRPDTYNALFLNPNTVAEAISFRLGVSKSAVLNPENDNIASMLATAESQLIQETKELMINAGINIEAFDRKNNDSLSRTTLLVKNLKWETTEDEIRALFAALGTLIRFVIAPTHAIAIVEYARPEEARKAFTTLNMRKLHDVPMFLQWAPEGVTSNEGLPESTTKRVPTIELKTTTLILKNVPFQATKKEVKDVCQTYGKIKAVRMPKKADGSGHRGFCFLDFNTRQEATSAFENLKDVHLYGRHLIVQPAAEGRNIEMAIDKHIGDDEEPPAVKIH